MFLRVTTPVKGGETYLSIVRSYRVDGKTRSKTIKSLGALSKLKEQYDDPITHFKEECKRMNEEAEESNEKITITFTKGEKIDKRSQNEISLGSVVILKYLHELGIDEFFENRRAGRNFKYNPCRILELLVANRIMSPSSKKAAYEAKGSFPRKCDFSLDDVYRSLSYLAKYADKLTSHMNKSLETTRGVRNTTCVYYDVTNYFFECDEDCTEEGLRRRGCSKEHRPNPIVQMGLLMDANGLPMGYDLFSGNTNDCLTMMPVLKKTLGEASAKEKRTIVVADKGLNTSDNIAACILQGNGYVFSQSIRKADASLKAWVLDQDGYDVREGFKIKSKLADKTITIRDGQGKTIATEKVPVRLVAFWSEDYDKRAKAERARVIEKSEKMVKSQASYEHAKMYGAGRYVRERNVGLDSGEQVKSVVELDKDAIAKDEVFDGYYCLVTSEEDKTSEEIIDIYRGLWKIEETFKVTKTDLEARPVFVSRQDHIQAHFLICYIALVVLRLLQKDLGNKYSTTNIAEALSQLVGHYMKENAFMFSYRNDLTDDISKASGIDLSRKILFSGEIADTVSKIKKS